MIVSSKGFDPKRLRVFIGIPQLGNEVHLFRSRGYIITENINEADIVVFTGGADISPSLYGEKLHAKTNPMPARDHRELLMYRAAWGKFKFGICRGGQLLNVLSGGTLWQDVNGHHSSHPIRDVLTGKELISTSVHHQAFRPGKGAVRVAVAKVSTRKESEKDYWDNTLKTTNPAWETDYEVLFYPRTRSLCHQGHPEFCLNNDDPFVEYCFELISRYYSCEDNLKKVG